MIDAHAHLTDRRYGNVSSVVDEYTAVGVRTVVHVAVFEDTLYVLPVDLHRLRGEQCPRERIGFLRQPLRVIRLLMEGVGSSRRRIEPCQR